MPYASRTATWWAVKAKTLYPPRPEGVARRHDDWPPDKVLALVQAGLLQGKSIGFLPTRVHVPDSKEAGERGWGDHVGLVIDEWLLLEYACVFLPANQGRGSWSRPCRRAAPSASTPNYCGRSAWTPPSPVGEKTSPPSLGGEGLGVRGVERPTPFTPLAEVERAAARAVEAVDWAAFAARRVAERIDRLRGRV